MMAELSVEGGDGADGHRTQPAAEVLQLDSGLTALFSGSSLNEEPSC